MKLHIRDPRARELAVRFAERRGVTMTTAVVDAEEAELRLRDERSLADRIKPIVDRLAAKAKAGGRDLTKDEIADMWGDP